MRLSPKHKRIIMDSYQLLKRCNEIGIDLDKLHKCNIERMGDKFIFVLSKDNAPPIPKDGWGLSVDIATQPDIVLIMESNENGNITFEETEKTIRLLNINKV